MTQTGGKAFLVTETEPLDRAALAAYVPVVQAALRAAGGSPAIIFDWRQSSREGEPPTN